MPRKRTFLTASVLAVAGTVLVAGTASAAGSQTTSHEVSYKRHTNQVTGTCDTSQHKSVLSVQADSYATDQSHPNNNSVTVTVDNQQLDSFNFGSSFPAKTYDLTSTENHHYVVQFTAWDDPDGSEGWTRKYEGDIVACEQPPIIPPHHHVKKHPKAHLSTNCTGHVTATLNNKRSNVKVPFFITAHKKSWSTGWKVVVRKHHARKFHFGGRKFPAHTIVTVRANGKLLDKVKVPPRCPKPPHQPPDTGMRVAPSAQRTSAPRLMVPAIGVNARVVQVGKTRGGAQAVTHSVSDVFPLA